jgi:BNR/Asp-box repeat
VNLIVTEMIAFAAMIVSSLSFTAICNGQSRAESGALPLVQIQRVDYTDGTAREPSIVQHSNGTLFVAGYGKGLGGEEQRVPRLWKSTDQGATWAPVNVGAEQEGAAANSDVSLAMAPDGTLYYATMEFDMKASEGIHIVVGASKDGGDRWHWTMVSKKRFDDRPWVAVAPDGIAHLIWNDGSGVYHVASRDQGTTWSDVQVIHAAGGSSHLAVGPNGEVAVRIAPVSASGNKFAEGADLIEISTDAGKTWQQRAAPGKRDWAPMDTPGATPRWVEPLAWDSHGALYSLWTNMKGVWLAQSLDRGVTWREYKAAESDELAYYPYLAANAAGELAATWFTGAGESLRWRACRIQLVRGRVRVRESAALQTGAWYVPDQPYNAPVRSSAGEYLSVIFLKSGEIAVVSPIQDQPAKRFGFTFWKFR